MKVAVKVVQTDGVAEATGSKNVLTKILMEDTGVQETAVLGSRLGFILTTTGCL